LNTSRLPMFKKMKNPKHIMNRVKGISLVIATFKYLAFILSITIITPFHLSVNSLRDTVIDLLFPVSTVISSLFLNELVQTHFGCYFLQMQ
jgi:hypothetical protein